MVDIQFNEGESARRHHQHQPPNKGLTGLLVKHGLAKNASQAGILMLSATVVLILISYTLLRSPSDAAEEVFYDVGIEELSVQN